MSGAFHSERSYFLPVPRQHAWSVLSRTDGLYQYLGSPSAQFAFSELSEGGTAIVGRARVGGVQLRWKELPFEWLEGEFYRTSRVFERGPLLKWTGALEFQEDTPERTHLRIVSDLTARNSAAGWWVRSLLAARTRRRLPPLMEQIPDLVRSKRDFPANGLKGRVKGKILQSRLKRLGELFFDHSLIAQLEKMLREASDIEVRELQPVKVARSWQRDRWEVARLFYHAVRAELLEFHWTTLCPWCRQPGENGGASLRDVHRTFRCALCAGKFEAQFDQTIELKFTAHPAIRSPAVQTFCPGDPGRTPHIVSQLLLAPGQRRSWKLPELTRPYRLRSPQIRDPVTLKPDDGPTPIFQPIIVCKPDHFEVRYEYRLVPDYAVQFLNPNDFPIQLILEKPEWDGEALTGAQITNCQEFRDLFPAEVLSPGESIPVVSQVFLLARLVLPTPAQRLAADAAAYDLLRKHLEVLREAVAEERGAIVTIMGSSAMAVFSQLPEALEAMTKIYARLPAANPNPDLGSSVFLSLALHVGACLAVNSNDTIDFFGPSVKIAADLLQQSVANELVISEEAFRQPAVVNWLQHFRKRAELKSFEDGALKFWRVPMV